MVHSTLKSKEYSTTSGEGHLRRWTGTDQQERYPGGHWIGSSGSGTEVWPACGLASVMGFTTAAGVSISKIGSVASGATGAAGAASAGAGFGGKVLGVLGLSNPVGWALLGVQVGTILWKLLRKPSLEPLPIKTHRISGGREVARWEFGTNRIGLEWVDGTALPGVLYRDNHIRLISAISEGEVDDIIRLWINQEQFEYEEKTGPAADPNLLIPRGGNVRRVAHEEDDSRWLLSPRDVAEYRFPTEYAFQFRKNFLANGNQSSKRSHGWEYPLDDPPESRVQRADGSKRMGIGTDQQHDSLQGSAFPVRWKSHYGRGRTVLHAAASRPHGTAAV